MEQHEEDEDDEDPQTENGTDGPVAQDKSVRRGFLGWVNEKVRERKQRKIEKTIKREKEEGNTYYWERKYPMNP